MPKRMHHFGLVVRDIEKSLEHFTETLDVSPWDRGIVDVPSDALRIVHFGIAPGITAELLQPTNGESRYGEFLQQHGEGFFHVSIFTDEFDQDVEAWRSRGLTANVQEKSNVFPGFTVRAAWLPPQENHGIWIELVDATSVPPDELR